MCPQDKYEYNDDDDEHLAYGDYDYHDADPDPDADTTTTDHDYDYDGQSGMQGSRGLLADAWKRFRPSRTGVDQHEHDAALAVSRRPSSATFCHIHRLARTTTCSMCHNTIRVHASNEYCT